MPSAMRPDNGREVREMGGRTHLPTISASRSSKWVAKPDTPAPTSLDPAERHELKSRPPWRHMVPVAPTFAHIQAL